MNVGAGIRFGGSGAGRRRFAPLAAASALLLLFLAGGCRSTNGKAARVSSGGVSSPAAAPRSAGAFEDVTDRAGVRFTLDNGERGNYRLISTTPGGCAFLDYDGDGRLDLFFVQAGPAPGETLPPGTRRPPCRLFRNQGNGTFQDVTDASGIGAIPQGYAQAVAVGDYDNDGRPDLYVTAYGGNRLLHNTGRGRFADVTEQAGVGDRDNKAPRWATSASWGDYDRDGNLDLVVLHYAPWTPATDKSCKNSKGQRTYCSPELYGDDTPRLFRNQGNGRFVDVSRETGMDRARGRGLAVVWNDFDHDDWPDLYVACDLTPNLLLKNRGGKRFEDVGLAAGVAYGPDATVLSGMGIAVGDYEGNGWESFVTTNFSAQPNTVYRATGDGLFEDATYPSGIGAASLNFLAWGIEFLDYDNDGWPDVVAGCGHMDPFIADTASNTTYKQRKQLFRNGGNGLFRDAVEDLGDLSQERVTRGLSVGDFDNDGQIDVLDNAHNQPARLYRNVSASAARNHWVTLRLEGVRSNRDAVGAKVWLTSNGHRRLASVRDGGSYASSSDRRLHFGLGGAARVDKIEVRWPSGRSDVFAPVAANRFYFLREGSRAPVPDPALPAP